ncbi:PKD domain-containing protein [Methanosarcina sp. Z-7115]|uniref:PKD domain-containing protein n=1 Tax=Methanosarcina baikalica TaxID=3073890 RepID=A0ABU2CX11_9EURY|nr:PKD domain-containing protein [Methanosarcina sp. Z-7115]MDR7664279.1 PKD domain-containing protein [Methanosarcina sp. Z-7115]
MIILFLGLMSASITHAETYSFVTKWGSSGNGAGQFYRPCAIVANPSGYVYVADKENARVQEFNSNGKFINQWGSTGNVSIFQANGVAVDSSGDVYIEDSTWNHIAKFDRNGNVITQFGSRGSGNGQFKEPSGVAVDSSGNVYVSDSGNNRIEKFNSNGNYLMQWGTKGVSNGQFNNPVDVVLDSLDNVYVADNGNHCIKKFDSNGNYLMQLGSFGNGDGQLNYIQGVGVDSSGNIYVADKGSDRIQKFDSDGNYITQWGSYGTNDGQFNDPADIAVDSSGNAYVADKNNDRIQKFALKNPPVPGFTSNVTKGYAPLYVQFTDTSTGTPTSWTWNFGDGTNSTVQNPIHKYSSAGSYTVVLTATNAAGSNKTTKTNYIKVTAAPPKPVANFISNVTSGNVPLNVAFTDKSSGTPTKWKWTFGDGTNSTVKNPTHAYSKVGIYTVALTATNAAGSNTTTKTNYIKVTAIIKPVASFTSDATSGNVPLNVAFTDKSSGTPTKWKWTFGDGTNSTQQNTTHTYSAAGNYTVSLKATNAAGSNTTTKTNYIKVTAAPPNPVAAFSATPISGNAPLNVSFTDTSIGTPTKWKWDFGDLKASKVQNPSHIYKKAGTYTVSLTVKNKNGINTTTKANYIKVIKK